MLWRMRVQSWEWINLNWWTSDSKLRKTLELLRMGEKDSQYRKQLWEDGNKLEWRILERNGARFKGNSSSVFKILEWRQETLPWIVEILQENQKRRGWANDEKNLTDLREIHMTDDNSFLRQLWKNFRIAPGKLEESGKILGKDLWVRAHSKETPLEWLEREIASVELNGLNETTSSK